VIVLVILRGGWRHRKGIGRRRFANVVALHFGTLKMG
jgi:hypothetical protein